MTTEINAAAHAGATPGETSPSKAVGRTTGSTKHGAGHWWQERLSSLALVVLFVWFIVSMLRLPDYTHATMVEWLSDPTAAVPMLLLIATTFWHIKMGLQVIVEDYVHDAGNKLFTLALINFLVALGAAFALFAVLKIALGGGAA